MSSVFLRASVMDSYSKSDLLEFMWRNDIKPRDDKLEEKLETYLLQEFDILSHDVEDYKKFHDDVIDFRRNIRTITKKRGWNKENILSKHSVGCLFYFMHIVWKFPTMSHLNV